jgi:uncharacterized membrane protein HdeD (DUF308 family)
MTMQLVIALSIVAMSATCFLSAAYMACREKKGWGWFLFVGLLVVATLPSTALIQP